MGKPDVGGKLGSILAPAEKPDLRTHMSHAGSVEKLRGLGGMAGAKTIRHKQTKLHAQ